MVNLKDKVRPIPLQDPSKASAAESVLLQFRQSPRPLPACRHLLDCSSMVEARFHAACTLRDALVRDWTSLAEEEVSSSRNSLVRLVGPPSMKNAG